MIRQYDALGVIIVYYYRIIIPNNNITAHVKRIIGLVGQCNIITLCDE